jgi:hypothetical protein
MNALMRFLIEALAVGGTAMILGRSRLFRAPRWWVARHLGDFAWDLAKCPWCLSVWIAFPLAWYTHLPLANSGVLNIILTWMAMVALSPLAGGIIYLCYGFMPHVPTEAEWQADESVKSVWIDPELQAEEHK